METPYKCPVCNNIDLELKVLMFNRGMRIHSIEEVFCLDCEDYIDVNQLKINEE